jgi:hypothetical protein
MRKLLPVFVFLATSSAFSQGSIAVEFPFAVHVSGAGNAVVLVGGMGGGTAGGMGGMTGGGMGGMTGGGMSGGMGGMSGGMSGFGGTPGNSLGSTYGGPDPTTTGGPRNTTCASRATTDARSPSPLAPFAAVHHAPAPPDIAARSNRRRVGII